MLLPRKFLLAAAVPAPQAVGLPLSLQTCRRKVRLRPPYPVKTLFSAFDSLRLPEAGSRRKVFRHTPAIRFSWMIQEKEIQVKRHVQAWSNGLAARPTRLRPSGGQRTVERSAHSLRRRPSAQVR